MKVFSTKLLPESSKQIFKENNITFEEWDQHRPMSKEELIQHCKGFDGVMVSGARFDKEIIADIKDSVKILSLISVGFDNIDIQAATDAGIKVGHTPDVLSEATADTAFILMQCVARKVIFNYKRVVNSQWGYEELIDNLGQDLNGKKLGILGLGRIGYYMALKSQKAYGMEILYHNRSHNEEAENALGAKYVSFEELIAQSDVLSIHTALTPETENLFNANIFQKMKKNLILVNTARGKIVNEVDLISALKEGKIWGAGLDVTNPEPMHPDNPLLTMENVVILPHIGSATENTRSEMGRVAAMNMVNGLTHKKMLACVNKEID